MNAEEQTGDSFCVMLNQYALKTIEDTASHLGLTPQKVNELQRTAFKKIFKALANINEAPEPCPTMSHYQRVARNAIYDIPKHKHRPKHVPALEAYFAPTPEATPAPALAPVAGPALPSGSAPARIKTKHNSRKIRFIDWSALGINKAYSKQEALT